MASLNHFIREVDMLSPDLNPCTVMKALINRGRPHYVQGVQSIGRLWRIYMSFLESRINLLTRKMAIISGKEVPIYVRNPFRINQGIPWRKEGIAIMSKFLGNQESP